MVVDRGQTEPLAALIAVTVVAGAFSLYAGFLTGFVSDLGSERDVSQATAQLVWEHLSEDGIYEYGTGIATEIPVAALPQGYHVYVNVTYVDGTGRLSEKDQAQFGADGTPANQIDPLAQGEIFERPIPVQQSEGEITPGMLTVVVWDAE
jgi:hypothetical protein